MFYMVWEHANAFAVTKTQVRKHMVLSKLMFYMTSEHAIPFALAKTMV